MTYEFIETTVLCIAFAAIIAIPAKEYIKCDYKVLFAFVFVVNMVPYQMFGIPGNLIATLLSEFAWLIVVSKGHRANMKITTEFLYMVYTMLGTGITGLVGGLLSGGKWLSLTGKNDPAYIYMAIIMGLSLIIIILVTRKVWDIIMDISGVLKWILFAVIVLGISLDFVKDIVASEYAQNPSGIFMAVDAVMLISVIGAVSVVLVKALLNRRKENTAIQKQIEKNYSEYEALSEKEEELRVIRHELKNELIGDEDDGQ